MIPHIRSKSSPWRFAAIIFATMTLAVYFPVLRGQIPFPRDTVVQFPAWAGSPRGNATPVADIGDLVTAFYPFRALAAEAVSGGELPLWNPFILAGTPFLANSQSALFYPLTASYYVLGLPAGWTLAIMIRMFLAALFMWLFVRSMGASQAGAILAGIVFAGCGFMTAWQGQSMGDAAIWLPLIFYATRRLQADPSARCVAWTALAFAMPVLAGHPETAGHLTLAGTAWALWLWMAPGPTSGRFDLRFLSRFAVAGGLAIGLASVQMIPTLEWLKQVGNSFDAVWPPLPLYEALGLVSRDALRSPNSAGVHIPEAAAYAGMITLLLCPLAALHKTRRHAGFLAVMILLAFGVSYGVEPLQWIAVHVPVVKAIKNWRAILIGNFGIAALAGLGVSALEEEPEFRGRRRLWALIFTVAAFIFTFILVYKLQRATGFRVEFMRRPSFSRALLIAGAIPIFWRLSGGLRGRLFAASVCVIAVFDLVTFGYGYTTFASRDHVFPNASVFDFLKTRANPFQYRIAAVREPYPVNSPMMYGLASADGYEVRLLRIRQFCADYSVNSPDSVSFDWDASSLQMDRRLDMLNIRYFVVNVGGEGFRQFSRRPDRYTIVFKDDHVAVFENRRVLPRAFAVPASGIEIIDEAANQMARVKDPSFDPEQAVVLSHAPPDLARVAPDRDDAFESKVDVVTASISGYTLRTTASAPAVIVISQTYYPGWKAFVDGQESPVVDANYALTGFTVRAGTHAVRLVFAPRSFRIGISLTCLSAAVLAIMVLSELIKRRGASFG